MQTQYIFSEVSHVGKVRANNEDSCKAIKTINGHLFIVCDGMGGAAEGKKASSLAVDSIVAFFNKEQYDNAQIALYKSLEFANEQIYATAQIFPDFKGMGTTACVILLQHNQFYYAHVGDSRIYLFSNKNLYQLTKDHSFVNQLVDQGTITIEESKTHRDKNRILKALGVRANVKPTISTQPMLLKEHDILLSCSDGLTDMICDDDIKELLNTELNLELKTKALVEKALLNGGNDNVTIQTIEITKSNHTKTEFIDKTLYSKKDLSKTAEDITIVPKKQFLLYKKVLITFIGLVVLVIFFIILFIRNNKPNLEKNSIQKEKTKTIETLINNKENDSIFSNNKKPLKNDK
jgi:serine/threonine protein phosphatase PrpC